MGYWPQAQPWRSSSAPTRSASSASHVSSAMNPCKFSLPTHVSSAMKMIICAMRPFVVAQLHPSPTTIGDLVRRLLHGTATSHQPPPEKPLSHPARLDHHHSRWSSSNHPSGQLVDHRTYIFHEPNITTSRAWCLIWKHFKNLKFNHRQKNIFASSATRPSPFKVRLIESPFKVELVEHIFHQPNITASRAWLNLHQKTMFSI